MSNKPTTAAGYTPEQVELVKQTCLYVATKLGDLMEELVVVGGLVPSLIIDQTDLPAGAERHVGTLDLDVGLSLAVLDQKLYTEIARRLRAAGLELDVNEQGNPTRQRWKATGTGNVTVDFLIPPSRPEDRGGRLRDIEQDFAAVIAPGLELAFEDRLTVALSGATIMGETTSRDIQVCGPGAFVVLKALAFKLRGENKDAYDLYYVVRNYAGGTVDVIAHLRPLFRSTSANEALDVLRRDFIDLDALGPRRAAEFITGGPDDEIQADVVGFVGQFLRGIDEQGP